ncbi:MAG: FHA domain-containing protein [Candidatus Hydrothermae bacterium]|nr:FHA domain-containing protein [Candidatus Hydrothermae bacterium]
MAIRGNLETLNLRTLVQVNCRGGYTARIHVWTKEGEGEIYIHQGQVVHAWFNQRRGKEALLYILSLASGEFLQEMNIEPPERTIQEDWSQIFLESLKNETVHPTTRLTRWSEQQTAEPTTESPVEPSGPTPIKEGVRPKGRLLVRRHGRFTGEEIDIEGDVIIGKFSPETGPVDVDLSFFPEAPYISRRHARIYQREDGKFVIEDLGSINGTYVNRGPRIVAPTVLNDGDEIALGNAQFIFKYVYDES